MTTTKRILVPVDFSECTDHVVDEAVALARRLDASLLLLNVVKPPEGLPSDAKVTKLGATEFLLDEARILMQAVRRGVEEHGVAAEDLVTLGDPATQIVGAADEQGVSYIVMGTHGRKGISRVLLGSVAEKVSRKAKQPVLTVRTQHRPSCSAGSCAWCPSHVTEGQARLRAELDG